MIEMRRLHVSRVTVYRYAKPVAFEHRMMFIVRLTDDSWSPQEQQRFSRSAPSTNPAYPNMIEEVRFAPDSPFEGDGFEPSVPLYGELGALGRVRRTRAAIVKPGTPDRARRRAR
jgi:hypothetical protein